MNSSGDDELLRVFDHGMFSSRRNGCVLFRNTYDASKKSGTRNTWKRNKLQNRQRSVGAGITMNDVDLSIENKQRIRRRLATWFPRESIRYETVSRLLDISFSILNT